MSAIEKFSVFMGYNEIEDNDSTVLNRMPTQSLI